MREREPELSPFWMSEPSQQPSKARWPWLALVGVLIGATTLALNGTLPQSANPICWAGADVDACDDSTELTSDLGPCNRDVEALKREGRPALFVQGYWGLLACHQWEDALVFQAGTYLERNSGDLTRFVEFVTGGYDFRMQDPRQVNDSSLPGVANLVADVYWYSAPHDHPDRRPFNCTIRFDLIRYAAVGHWQIEYTESDSGDC